MELYHLSPIPLEVGSIILPGNFGRLIKLQKGQGDTLLLREFIYETERIKYFPEKPSRMESLFAFPDKESAYAFIVTYRKDSKDLLYKVCLVEEKAKTHIAPIKLVGNMDHKRAWDCYNINAKKYWGWDSCQKEFPMEVVTMSSLKILSKGICAQEFISVPLPISF